MDLAGERLIAAPKARVWDALNDPEVLKLSIPGCEEIEKTSPTEFTAKVSAKVGPVKARFAGKVTLSDLDPPHGYKISGEGQGGAAGFAKGSADVTLAEAEGGTLLSYRVNAQVGGKLAQIGSRLIDGTARKMSEDFFAAFAAAVERTGQSEETPEPAPATAPDAPPPSPQPAPSASSGLSPIVWVGGVLVVVAVLILIFS